MGVNTRRPVLPAPTESLVDTIGGSVTGTDLATDISRRTDKSSYSIPDDGSPVTLSTRRHRDRDDKLSHSHRDSQTSLLIEYFEGGKGSSGIVSRPSVRVRVTPSGSRKFKDKDHIQITESGSSRKPSYTRRISLTSPSSKPRQLTESNLDDISGSESNSAEEGQRSSRDLPVEIEFMNRDQGSEVSAFSRDARYMPTSDVSSMPADSMLEGASSAGPRRKRSQSLERGAKRESKDLLKTPSRQRSRSLSHERIVNRVAEKLNESSHDVSSSKKSKSKGRSRNAGKDHLEAEPTKPSSRRRRHGAEDEYIPSPESSLLSTSNVSSNRKSDAYSVRSGASKTSINNPKLLETVEDAIRRLILPELKELKKDQKVMSNTSKFERERERERDMTTSYSSTSSRDELGRRLSKHASAPDVMKPKVVLNKNSKDEGIVLAGESAPQTKERKSSKTSDTSDAGWVKYNRPDLTEQEKLRRQKSKGLRDAHAAARVGSALTSASLRHHDSQSSIGKKERRASGSQRSVDYNETELVFQKHNVPAMPMHSAIDSELTRASLLSERTESPTPRKRVSLAEISRGSPRQVVSPTGHTPTRTPLDSRFELGMRHGNQSQRDLSMHSASDRDLHAQSQSPASESGNWAIAAAAAANLLDASHPGTRDSYIEPYETGRQLSPIQSVASERTEVHGEQYPNKYHTEAQQEVEPRLSIESLSSAPSTNLARSTRQGVSPRSQSGFSKYEEDGPELGYEQSRHVYPEDDIFGHEEESKLSYGQDDSEIDFMDKVKEGQHVTPAIAANPQYVQAMGIESNVASLMDPSVLETSILETQSYQSGSGSQTDLAPRSRSRSPEKPANEVYRGSPLKQRQDASSPDETSFTRRMGVTSPPQSVTQSIEDLEEAGMVAAAARGIDRGFESPLPEADQRSQESESEINTNPSIIQGPIGGLAQGNGDQWAYDSRSPPAGQVPYYESNPAGAKDLGAQPRGLDAEYYETARNIFGGDDYYPDQRAQQLFDTPPGAKDEGYVSAANPVSPSVGTPKQGSRGVGAVDAFGAPAEMDEMSAGHQRHFSGYSHGVGSPLYDSATGHGIERIKSKDIVALMDHLTVRDAQRNARDTEMLVTLVRSAAEMRTSFDEMKKFIAQQDELLLDSTEKQHERLNQVLGGPRPLPPSGSRTRQLNLEDDEDLQSKRKNIFKRALKGLSLKSGNDLSKIEGMLEQLLDEVEALRDGQGMASPRVTARMSVDANTFDNNGQNGVAQGSQSPYTSSPARQANADPRVSTVPEEDEDEDEDELDESDPYMTSHLPVQDFARHERAGSLPLATPPRKPLASGTRSNETTPKASTDKAEKARKHKSSSSSIFPKFSRWSKTTASSMGDNIRNSIQPGRKERPYSENLSRSGSDLAQDAYQKANYYDAEGDDRLRSPYGDEQENRPPSPLVPSQVSEAPKYRAHRGSLDLQHPQPRQGPTGRFQSALETQAQAYATPGSPNSERWGSQPSLPAVQPAQNRFSAGSRLSPISDAGYSEHSSRATGPPRPPKVKDEGPLIPERPPKVLEDEDDQASTTYGDRVISRGSAIRSPPTRKPTGPRPLTSGGSYSPGNVKRTRYRGSPMQIDYEDEY